MEKEALTLKFRPQTFEEFIGQDQVTTILKNAIKNRNIYHAYIFYGPRGVGKTSAARIVAKMLNCKEGPTPKPCNKCENCLEIAKGNSPDVIEIDGASNRGINEIRELQESIRYVPIKSKYKIYIIDEVHMLTKEAFNALLKTLEEPPHNVIFIFATTEIHKVLPTIRSRCQQFQFHLFNTEQIINHLKNILAIYRIDYEEKALFWIAKYAYGSMRDALAILSQILATKTSQIKEEQILSVLGIQPFEIIVNIFDAFVKKDIKRIYEIVHDVYISGIDFNNFIQQMVEFLRDISLVKVGITSLNYLNLTEEQVEEVKKFTDFFDNSKIFIMVEKLSEFSKNLNIYYNPYPYFENLMVSFTNIDNYIPNYELIKTIKQATTTIEKFLFNENFGIREISLKEANKYFKKSELTIKKDSDIKIKEDEKKELDFKIKEQNLKEKNKDKKDFLIDKEFSEILKKDIELDKNNNTEEINNDKIKDTKILEDQIKEENIAQVEYKEEKKDKDQILSKMGKLIEKKKQDIANENIPKNYIELMNIIDGEYLEKEVIE